ncbi:MAG: hypothetical protein GEV10_04140 [Streptosporangiales bacterium]|nr:hypothetical protein [Streptosporangiales bacterium]
MSDAVPDDDRLASVEGVLDELLEAGVERTLPDPLLQKMFTLAVRQYSRRYEEDPGLVPLLGEHVNATDVSNCCLEMLRVVDLEVFELTFWGGRLSADRG